MKFQMCWLALSACLMLAMATQIQAEDSPYPIGEVTKYTFDSSKIFPGTVRDYWVYVPQQYDGTKPACVFVFQDGLKFNAPKVFDELIAKKEMPVTIGVFIMHGRTVAPNDNAMDRFNRSFEYDGMGDNYARFLLDELLPDVEKKTTKDGRAILLSKDGNDRAIAGSSSGAVCAFTAAWERPDAFSRVFSSIGTYVALRGANEYPSYIRKYEPKPLRVFLEDGENDLNIYAGDWWMVNQEMERAMIFSGYEVNHKWGTGGHDAKLANVVFPEATKWLWKDWPQSIKKGHGSPQLQKILIPGEEWQLVSEGHKGTEGPCVNQKGEVFFNDVSAHKTYKVGLNGKIDLFLSEENKRDGQRFGPDGRLFSVAGGTSEIVAYDEAGKGTKIADGFRGNDMVVLKTGGMYVTSPGWDGTSPSQIYYISPEGEKKVVDKGLKFSNGIATSPDQTLLFVADSKTHWAYSYQIQPNGDLKYKQKYFHLHVPDSAEDSGVDGVRTDTEGRVYFATRMGIQICDQPGRVNCIVPTPNGKISNLEFGGEKFDTIYATCGDKVYKRKLNVKGYASWMDPIKPPKPGL
jgi:sugar lactone lactonase YvrE/enterochelin esterase-like enzyme